MAVLRRVLLPFASRFVTGETMESALQHARELNEDNISAMVDLLGEHVDERDVAEDARDRYRDLLRMMEEKGVDGCISIKLTHLGLEIDEDFCRENVEMILETGGEVDRFVWLDMESSRHTQQTIDLYRELHRFHDNLGICIQSYLKRSRKDVQGLVEEDATIRLVKGAYDEPEEVAFQDRDEVDRNYRELMGILFNSGTYFAVATHDLSLIEIAKDLGDEFGKGRDDFEFEFLMGVREELKRELADGGYRVREYVPYGPEWLSYYYRRIRERRENLVFALRAVLPV